MKRISLLLLAPVLLVVIAVVARFMLPETKRQTLELQDGTVMELMEVTVQGKHMLRTGPNWKKLTGWMPAFLRNKFPQETNEHTISTNDPIGIWLRGKGDLHNKLEFRLCGPDGIEISPISQGGSNREFIYVGFLPPMGEAKEWTLGLIAPEKTDESRSFVRVGEFQITPPRGLPSISGYTPRPLPQTESHDGLEVMLKSLQVIAPRKAPRYGDDFKQFQAQANFEIVEKANLLRRWEPVAITTSDRVGSTIRAGSNSRSGGRISFAPHPSPVNPWKLDVTVSKVSGFDAGELVTFENVQMPQTSDEATRGESRKVNGCEIRLSKVSKGDSYGDKRTSARIYVDLISALPNTRITLVSCTSASGEKIEQGGWGWGDETYNFEISNFPADTKTVTVVFAVHQCRIFEFYAQPQIVDSLRQ